MAQTDLYNAKNEKVGSLELPGALFGGRISAGLLHEVASVTGANERAGTRAHKTRGAVSGGGKKPWKQKGTGRARQGSTRASQFVGGGKAMGPKPRDYSYDVPRKVRKLALRSALALRNSEQKILIVDRWAPEAPKTGAAKQVLAKLGVKKALVVDGAENAALQKSIRNLSGSDFLATQGLNVYDILGHEYLVLTADSAKRVEEALS
jgi:large subunit ribosomal protein L4